MTVSRRSLSDGPDALGARRGVQRQAEHSAVERTRVGKGSRRRSVARPKPRPGALARPTRPASATDSTSATGKRNFGQIFSRKAARPGSARPSRVAAGRLFSQLGRAGILDAAILERSPVPARCRRTRPASARRRGRASAARPDRRTSWPLRAGARSLLRAAGFGQGSPRVSRTPPVRPLRFLRCE